MRILDPWTKASWCHLQVERHLRTGDIVLFNRQPSLHKMSMMVSRSQSSQITQEHLQLAARLPGMTPFDRQQEPVVVLLFWDSESIALCKLMAYI